MVHLKTVQTRLRCQNRKCRYEQKPKHDLKSPIWYFANAAILCMGPKTMWTAQWRRWIQKSERNLDRKLWWISCSSRIIHNFSWYGDICRVQILLSSRSSYDLFSTDFHSCDSIEKTFFFLWIAFLSLLRCAPLLLANAFDSILWVHFFVCLSVCLSLAPYLLPPSRLLVCLSLSFHQIWGVRVVSLVYCIFIVVHTHNTHAIFLPVAF